MSKLENFEIGLIRDECFQWHCMLKLSIAICNDYTQLDKSNLANKPVHFILCVDTSCRLDIYKKTHKKTNTDECTFRVVK